MLHESRVDVYCTLRVISNEAHAIPWDAPREIPWHPEGTSSEGNSRGTPRYITESRGLPVGSCGNNWDYPLYRGIPWVPARRPMGSHGVHRGPPWDTTVYRELPWVTMGITRGNPGINTIMSITDNVANPIGCRQPRNSVCLLACYIVQCLHKDRFTPTLDRGGSRSPVYYCFC